MVFLVLFTQKVIHLRSRKANIHSNDVVVGAVAGAGASAGAAAADEVTRPLFCSFAYHFYLLIANYTCVRLINAQ